MDKNIRYMNKEILNGKNLEENIPQLFNHLSSSYRTYASVRLAMHYYSFYEAYCDDEDTWGREATDIAAELNKMIGEAVIKNQSGSKLEETIRKVDGLRDEVMKRMKVLAVYTDIFQIYEYVLNRTEYRFKDNGITLDEEEFEKEVLRYIFDSEDNLIINEKIREMVGQLPIRMTKQKFFDLLKESFPLYLGAEKASLETYLYMLRTSSMLYQEEGMQTYYPKLWERKEQLAHLNFKEVTKEEFEEAESSLRLATLILESESGVYYNLQEILNEVYAILLCSPYAGMLPTVCQKQEDVAFTIIAEIQQAFSKHSKKEVSTSLLDQFSLIEGVQEDLSEELQLLEDSVYEVDRNHRSLTQSLMIEKFLNVLLRSGKLLSNSLFIDLDAILSKETVDEETLGNEMKALVEELSTLFAEHDKIVSRAVMASILSKLPVFFQTHKEVMDYVRYSIEHCTERYEKLACVEIIRRIMSE